MNWPSNPRRIYFPSFPTSLSCFFLFPPKKLSFSIVKGSICSVPPTCPQLKPYALHIISISFFFFLFCKFLTLFFFNFIFKLYNIVLGLLNIEMNLPQVYPCSPSWTLLPPPSPYPPSGSSQCTSPKHPVSCIKPGLVTRFIHDNIHVSMPFSQISPPSPSPTESIRLIYTSVSLLLSRTQGYCYHLSKFHISISYEEMQNQRVSDILEVTEQQEAKQGQHHLTESLSFYLVILCHDFLKKFLWAILNFTSNPCLHREVDQIKSQVSLAPLLHSSSPSKLHQPKDTQSLSLWTI